MTPSEEEVFDAIVVRVDALRVVSSFSPIAALRAVPRRLKGGYHGWMLEIETSSGHVSNVLGPVCADDVNYYLEWLCCEKLAAPEIATYYAPDLTPYSMLKRAWPPRVAWKGTPVYVRTGKPQKEGA